MPEQDRKPYRQRNTSGYVLTVPELGREFGPDDEVDHPYPICGFTAVADLKATEKDDKKAPAKASAGEKDKETSK
jgi:hypothetical protein